MKYGVILKATTVAFFLVVVGYAFQSPLRSVVADSIDGDTDESMQDPEAFAAAAALAADAPKLNYQVSSSTPQFVVLSFDGSKSVDMLQETLAFEQKMQAEGKHLRFTYFINAAYFLSTDTANLYQAPGKARGISNVGFSKSAEDIPLRVEALNRAFAEGNEIGSHTAGHFDGTSWSLDEWKQEFTSFASLMSHVQQNNSSQHIDAPTFLQGIRGFRAPLLGVNDNLYKVLGDFHFTYDASGVGGMSAWPHKDAYGVWRIPLGTIFLGSGRSPAVAMDYSLWAHQSGAKEKAVKGTVLWDTNYAEIETAYMNYFDTNYNGGRAPIVIGNHFSKWNDGVYWEAMKNFAEQVCGQPQVRCVTFSELVDYLNATGAPPVIR